MIMMNKPILFFFLLVLSFFSLDIISQEVKMKSEKKISKLFRVEKPLSLKMSYSNNELRKTTNDSTYLHATISYKTTKKWKDLKVEYRARGKFRKEKCYFVPVKLKIKKANSKGTLFKGQKKLKMVVPCIISEDMNDNVLKEFIAYKIYEKVTKYNFKTRLIDILLSEKRRNEIKEHRIKGFLIEDDKKVADRFNAKILERPIPPLEQDNITSIKNAFFQFMIGNVDFSIVKQHNVKLFYIGKRVYPIPYDFDMNGFVDPDYEIISSIASNNSLISRITQRKFRGFKRNVKLFEMVRKDFLKKETQIMNLIDSYKGQFQNELEFTKARRYIVEFFKIISSEGRFKKQILNQLR